MAELIVKIHCKNKENMIKHTTDKIIKNLKKLINEEVIDEGSYLLIFDMASKDNSWYEIGKAVARNPYLVKAKKLKYDTKIAKIIENTSSYYSLIDFDDCEIEKNINKKPNFIKDIFKNSNYSVIDEFN